MGTEEFNLLWAALTTAGVQAEARRQIVGPESPVISAYEELFSDVKWSSGLREQFGNEKAQFQLKGETQTRLSGGSI